MSADSNTLRPEDYAEPRCLLGTERFGSAPEAVPVPVRRIQDKLDGYLARRDYAGAERHLLYWLKEAELGRDARGRLFLCNELIGHYRKAGEREKALFYAEEALALVESMGLGDTSGAGTTFVNAATACNAFGEDERALKLFSRARAVYESDPETAPELLGALYNNMALAYQALERYADALALYEKALSAMERVPGGAPEQAVTCLNMADVVAAEQGTERGEARIAALLDRACALLQNADVPRDGKYAFFCEKCAPVFSYYGYFAAARELQEEAERIYERN